MLNFIYEPKYLQSKIFPSNGLLYHLRDANLYYTVHSVEVISLCLWLYDATSNNSLNVVLFALPNGIKIFS